MLITPSALTGFITIIRTKNYETPDELARSGIGEGRRGGGLCEFLRVIQNIDPFYSLGREVSAVDACMRSQGILFNYTGDGGGEGGVKLDLEL